MSTAHNKATPRSRVLYRTIVEGDREEGRKIVIIINKKQLGHDISVSLVQYQVPTSLVASTRFGVIYDCNT